MAGTAPSVWGGNTTGILKIKGLETVAWPSRPWGRVGARQGQWDAEAWGLSTHREQPDHGSPILPAPQQCRSCNNTHSPPILNTHRSQIFTEHLLCARPLMAGWDTPASLSGTCAALSTAAPLLLTPPQARLFLECLLCARLVLTFLLSASLHSHSLRPLPHLRPLLSPSLLWPNLQEAAGEVKSRWVSRAQHLYTQGPVCWGRGGTSCL